MDTSVEYQASSAKIPKEKIKLSKKIRSKDMKVKPIRADHIIIKKGMMKMHSMS